MIEFARSPYVNRMFDDYRRGIYGNQLMTEARIAELVKGFTDGMKPAAIQSLRADPFFGIASKGRTGARGRMEMRMAGAKTFRRPARDDGRIFRNDRRHAKFTESYKSLIGLGYNHESARKQAAKNARRILIKGN